MVGGSFLYENVGGRFVDRSERLPAELDVAYTRVAGFHDLDLDGSPELYVVNDMSSVRPNMLLHNVGGRWVPDEGRAGLDLQRSGGGLGVGDVNEDGVLDLLVPHWERISLMLSIDGHWYDHADALGLQPDAQAGQTVGHGAELADIDNDGDLDALVAYGHLEVGLEDWGNPERQPDALFLQRDDGTFYDVAPDWGVDDPGAQRGFVVADLDRDGWLDLIKRDLSGPDVIYLSHCGDAHWMTLGFEHAASPNRFAVGAVVQARIGDRVLTRTVTAGGTGFGTGGPPEVHFGFGNVDIVDHLEVIWPDGAQTVLGTGIPTDRHVRVVRD